MKNILIPQIAYIVLILFLSFHAQAQNSDNHVSQSRARDLIAVLRQIPNEFSEIDNITIRLLHSKVTPQNATECIKALPDLLMMRELQTMDYHTRLHKINTLIVYFEDIFASVSSVTYYEICNELKLKENEENDLYIYNLITQSLRRVPMVEKEKNIPLIIKLMPLEKGVNELIICSLYDNFNEDRFLGIIKQIKERYPEDQIFIQEIEEAKEQILYNKTHKIDYSRFKIFY